MPASQARDLSWKFQRPEAGQREGVEAEIASLIQDATGCADSDSVYAAMAVIRRIASAPQPGQQWNAPAIPEGTREAAMVVIERDQNGKPTVWCDPEIVDLVGALNNRSLRTVASCSGHGGPFGIITMEDGRELLILPNWDSARVAERVLGAAFDAQRGGEGA